MNRAEIIHWLRTSDEAALESLWQEADAVRRREVGDAVHLRGLIEVSNRCVQQCAYCGIRAGNRTISRYTLRLEEILASVALAQQFGYGSVVLQAGETPQGLPTEWVAEVIQEIRRQAPEIAITLSLGERGEKAFETWRLAGANRYLLRMESSNPTLFRKLHPQHPGWEFRLAALKQLQKIGYEVGSGVMIGVPGETWDDLAADIEMFRSLELDMVGVGPFLPHPQTPMGTEKPTFNDELTTLKTIALTRLLCPGVNIPSTTALAAIDRESGHERGLSRGANVIMPNVTPPSYRQLYEIYPSKANTSEAAETFDRKLKERIWAMGRTVGTGRGNAKRKPS